MKKSHIIAITSIVVASSLLNQVSFARGFGSFKQQGCSFGIQQDRGNLSQNENSRIVRLAPILGLTDEQTAEIQSILDANKEQMEIIRNSIKEIRNTLNEQSMSSEYNEENVLALADQVSNIVVLKSKERFDIAQILTNEQKQKLEEMRHFFEHRDGHNALERSERAAS